MQIHKAEITMTLAQTQYNLHPLSIFTRTIPSAIISSISSSKTEVRRAPQHRTTQTSLIPDPFKPLLHRVLPVSLLLLLLQPRVQVNLSFVFTIGWCTANASTPTPVPTASGRTTTSMTTAPTSFAWGEIGVPS